MYNFNEISPWLASAGFFFASPGGTIARCVRQTSYTARIGVCVYKKIQFSAELKLRSVACLVNGINVRGGCLNVDQVLVRVVNNGESVFGDRRGCGLAGFGGWCCD